ncbi:PREDICTED: tumor necrosis factor receptor superfamily member 1A [Nanorana parkeri]|uniref:tumor necrosis factor receptor superfamily member 1A n=1 Tax=Nanorana parkeri TaxID=125878 RepID=UPI0008540E34|nr:PREDICTED: tumor necrosis factor receptor superfamily member 1A [Nanorana parkeri]
MRALFLVVSFLWVFPVAYQALNIPLPNALLIHGEPVGFNTSSRRWKRAEKDNVTATCNDHEYKPRKRNYCCNKCLAGYKVAGDCSGDGQTTQCVPCDIGTYTEIPNRSKDCLSCTTCLQQYGQIALSNCTADKNTRCGCPAGHFKQLSGRSFTCEECTTCENGTQRMACHDNIDTICECFHNFFLDQSEKRCRHCSECQTPECKDHCPHPVPVGGSKGSDGVLSIVLGVLMVVLIVGAVGACVVYAVYIRKHPSSSDTKDEKGQTAVLIHHQESDKNPKNQELPGYSTTYDLCNEQHSKSNSTDGLLPLPDITKGTAPPCLSNPKLVYAIIENIPMSRWREFVRRLGLSNHTIESCEQDYRLHYKDAQYAMLQVWITREGCPTTKRDQLFNILREISLGGCIEKIEEYL